MNLIQHFNNNPSSNDSKSTHDISINEAESEAIVIELKCEKCKSVVRNGKEFCAKIFINKCGFVATCEDNEPPVQVL